MADSRLYMPNAVRIRENLDGLNGLYRMKAIPGMDNPLYEATERAPLPDGYTNKGETRALDDARPFLLLTFLESALEVTTKKGLSLERTFSAKLANSQGAGKAGAAKVLISIGNSPDRPRSTDQGKAKESDKQKEKQYQKPSDKDKDSEEKKRQRLKELEKEQRRRESQSQEAFRNGQKGSRPLTASGHG